jgi:hypothetical protein
LTGENRAAQVSASKVLVDALSDGRDSTQSPAREAVNMADVRRKLDAWIAREAAEIRREEIEERAEQLAQERP